MIIGLILCAVIAVLLFFGVAERVFKSFGVGYWAAFMLVGALIGCAFIPSFTLGNARINIAGFLSPVAFSVLFFVLASKTRELWRSLITAAAVCALAIAVFLLLEGVAGTTGTAVIAGVLCGVAAFFIAGTELAALAGTFLGFPLGSVAASGVNSLVYGGNVAVGSAASYDGVIIAAVTAVVLFELVAAIRRAKRERLRAARGMEAADDFDPDEYKKYFDE